jgi:hypothetical protein
MWNPGNEGNNPEEQPHHIGWWERVTKHEYLPAEEVEKIRANSLIATARNLENLQREVHEQNLFSAQLYSNRELAAFDWGTNNLYRASLAPVSRTGENLVLMVVDTLVSQVGKNRPKAKPQTRGASWKLRQAAKRLDKFLYGEFVRNRVWDIGKRVFRDGCVFSFGAAYPYMDDDRLRVERVFPDEILVDQMEVAACGRARHWYRRRVLPKEVAAVMFGCSIEDLETEIDSSPQYLEWRKVGKSYCVVVEGWQCARGDKPGVYVAATHNKILKSKPYTLEEGPFVTWQYSDPLSGFFSPSAVEQAIPYQIRLNEINDVIRDAQDLMGRPRLLIHEGSRVNPLEIDNMVGRFVKYTGVKPEAVTWPAINAEIYNERDRLVRVCLEQFGLSQLSSKQALPAQARLDSAPALNMATEIQDGRLGDLVQRYERFYLNLAEQMIRVVQASGENPKTTWVSGGRKGMVEEICWDEIDLDENAYVLQLEAASSFSQTPAAIRDDLEKQLATGLISPETYRLELCDPDSESELVLAAAAADDIRRVIDLLEEGEWEDPEPIQDLVNGVQTVSLAALHLKKYKDVPDTVKINFADWLTAARNILAIGEETPPNMDPAEMVPGLATPPPLGGPGGDPMMGGAPPPTFAGAPGPAAIPIPESLGLGGRVRG